MPNISDLPPELLHHILSLAHESTHWIPTPRRMPLLCSASLVCAAWAETTQRLMMECLTLEREGDVEKVRGKLRRRQVGALVRHLTDKTGQEGLRVVVEGARKVEHLCLMATEEKYDMDTVRMVLEKGLRSLLLLSPLAGEKFNLAPKSVLSLTHLLLTPLHEPPPRFLIPLLAFTPHLTRLNLFYPSCPTGSGRDFTRNSLAALDQVLGEVKALTLSDYTPEPEEGGKKWEMRASPSYILPACRSLKSLEIDVEAWSAIVPILQLVPTRLEALETTPSPAKEGVAMAMLEAMKCRSVQGLKRWRVTRLGKVEEEGEALREWREACGKRGIEVRDEKRYFADQISPTY